MELEKVKVDKGVLEEVLRKQVLDETVEIVEIRNNYATAKGANFLSDIFKVSVSYTTRTRRSDDKQETNEINENFEESVRNMFIKVERLDTNGFADNIFREQYFFSTELTVLRDVLPKIEELLATKIGPELWYGTDNPAVLIMEDLTKEGFVMKDRQKGLPFDHCLLAIKQIAKLHAASVAFYEQDPLTVKSFNGGIVSEKCPKSFLRMMEVSLIRLGRAIENWSDKRCARVTNKLNKLSEKIGSECMNAYNYDPDEFCVLNHGDCWINNMMFKEDDQGQPIGFLLVDYQMSVYTSPAIDLLYFLTICPEISLKCENDEYFFTVYLDSLKATMKKIGCKTKPPSMDQLKESIHKRRVYAVFSGLILYFRMIANEEDTEDFNEVFVKLSGETKLDVFKNPDAVRAALKMIPAMDERGYFD